MRWPKSSPAAIWPANLDLVEEFARKAKAGGADLVVFPEATMRAFGNSLLDIAEPLDGSWASPCAPSQQSWKL